MTPYFVLFVLALCTVYISLDGSTAVQKWSINLFFVITFLMVGLRSGVGGDWDAYSEYLRIANTMSFLENLSASEPGFMLVNWAAGSIGFGVTSVNVVAGGLFTFGLYAFCKQQPSPALALLVTTPYLIIIVAMGYTRQSMALGFFLYALAIWSPKNLFRCSFILLLSIQFHKSSIILLFFLLFLVVKRDRAALYFILLSILFLVAILTVLDSPNLTTQVNAYVVNPSYESAGATVRLLLSVIPSILLLIFRKQFLIFDDFRIWEAFAVFNLLLFAMVFNYSFLVDRVGVYFSLIQPVFYSRAVGLILCRRRQAWFVMTVICLYGAALYTWLNFGAHAPFWVPYRWLFES